MKSWPDIRSTKRDRDLFREQADAQNYTEEQRIRIENSGRQGASILPPAQLFLFMLGSIGELIKYRSIGFLMSNCVFPSYIVTDQNAFTGGYSSFAKVSV